MSEQTPKKLRDAVWMANFGSSVADEESKQTMYASAEAWEKDQAENAALRDELLRCRTTEMASAHALDVVRQAAQVDLIPGEHPAELGNRINTSRLGLALDLAALRERVKELEAIVQELPKTADGFVIRPNMGRLWIGSTHNSIPLLPDNKTVPVLAYLGFIDADGENRSVHRPSEARHLYTTQEAAQASLDRGWDNPVPEHEAALAARKGGNDA